MYPVRFNLVLIRSGKFGSEKVQSRPRGRGLSAGGPLSSGVEKVERGIEGWRGQGRCQHRHQGPGLETKIIQPRSGSFRKPPGRYQLWAFAEWRKRELSVCLFGLRPLRNDYSLLITIWRKEMQRSGLGCLEHGTRGLTQQCYHL